MDDEGILDFHRYSKATRSSITKVLHAMQTKDTRSFNHIDACCVDTTKSRLENGMICQKHVRFSCLSNALSTKLMCSITTRGTPSYQNMK